MAALQDGIFYWVRPANDDEWQVAQWLNGKWWFCGNDMGASDVAQVGPRVEPPILRERLRRLFHEADQWPNNLFQRYVSFIARRLAFFFQGSRADSQHIRDCVTTIAVWTLVLIGGALLVAMLLAGLWWSTTSTTMIAGTDVPPRSGSGNYQGNPMVSVFATGMLTVFGAFIGYAVNNILAVIDKAGKRLGLVDMVASDILALCNIIDQMKLFNHFEALWRHEGSAPVDAEALQARSEDYFEVWSKSIADLGGLDREAIKRITRFYAYLKASRDATLQLGHLSKDEYKETQDTVRRARVESVIVLLALCLRNARLALDSLLEDHDPERNDGFRFVVDANLRAYNVLSVIVADLPGRSTQQQIADLKLNFTSDDRAVYFDGNAWRAGSKGRMT